MKVILLPAVLLGTLAAVYAMPTLAEIALMHFRVNPWMACVLLGDLPGSVVLYKLGFRKAAIVVYLSATVGEALMLGFQLIPAATLVWITNAIPAAIVSVVVVKAALRYLVVAE